LCQTVILTNKIGSLRNCFARTRMQQDIIAYFNRVTTGTNIEVVLRFVPVV